MINKNHKVWLAVWGISALSSGLTANFAHSQLVYESDVGSEESATPAEESRIEERGDTRQMLDSSERAKSTLDARGGGRGSQTVVVQNTPYTSSQAQTKVDVDNVSRSELMRRERVRAELRNEDLLQERLEELRLAEERRRLDQVLSGTIGTGTPVAQGVQDVVVTGNDNVATVGAPVDTTVVSTTTVVEAPAPDDGFKISVSPRFGIAGMAGGANYDVQSKFTTGLGLQVSVTDSLTFELGYQYGEYGVMLASTNPYVLNYQYYLNNSESVVMKQNIFDAGVKLHILGAKSKIRPYLGGGGAYSKSFVNYDDRIISGLKQMGLYSATDDYAISSFLGYLSTGADLSISKMISVGLNFRYYAVLSARENQSLNNSAFGYSGYGNCGYGGCGYSNGYNSYLPVGNNALDADKRYAGGSLARSSFYTIMGNVTFSF